MIDSNDFIIKDFYCKKTGKYKPQRWVMHFCINCKNKRSYLPKTKTGLCASCSKDKFLKNKLGENYKQEVVFKEKLKNKLRNRLNCAIKNNYKSGSAVQDLGCSIEEFKTYIENQFQPGMTWNNWTKDGWHIDHKIAISKFNLSIREELLKACHYTNLQPLWAEDNLRKGIK